MKLWIIVFLLCCQTAWAHKPSDSYLNLDASGATVSGRWDIALRDLQYAIGLDSDADGLITWGELKAQYNAVAEYALLRLSVYSAGERCQLWPTQQLVDQHSDGAYAVLQLDSDCATNSAISVDYRLFFDLDPSHRGLLSVAQTHGVTTAVLSPEQPRIEVHPAGRSRLQQFLDYWREGLWHIWIGFDHILFLVALLLPAVLRRSDAGWQMAGSLKTVLRDIVAVVTAFTVAHSITLSAAVLGWISLPSRWVETAIAATLILTALNNLLPLIRARRWLIGFTLGLIHGFGFASVLADLGLPSDALLLALMGFNLGVETGQLVIVLGFLPLAYGLRHTWFYRRVVLQCGSLAVCAIAVVWLLERSAWVPALV